MRDGYGVPSGKVMGLPLGMMMGLPVELPLQLLGKENRPDLEEM